jgi:hypothetical protein
MTWSASIGRRSELLADSSTATATAVTGPPMFRSTWSWIAPLVGAALTFLAVLLTTPPGLRALSDVVLGSPRGPSADAAAYALGAAGSLALLVMLGLAILCGILDAVLHRRRRMAKD